MATVPEPLYYRNDGNLQIMTASDITGVINQAITLYGEDPSVVLGVSGTSIYDSDLGPMTNTLLAPGTTVTNTTNFTDINTLRTSYPLTSGASTNYFITQNVTSTSQPVDPLPILRRSDGNIKPMTPNQFLDTFIYPAIDFILDSNNYGSTLQGGSYKISTSSSLADNTLVGTAFVDTTYNSSTSFYLHKQDGLYTPASSSGIKVPAFVRTDGNIQAYTLEGFNNLLQKWIKHTVATDAGYKIRYSLDTGSIMGSGMTDTNLNGDAVRNIKSEDDYYSTLIPAGAPTVINTYYLRMKRE